MEKIKICYGRAQMAIVPMAIVPFKTRIYPGIFRIGVVRLQVYQEEKA